VGAGSVFDLSDFLSTSLEIFVFGCSSSSSFPDKLAFADCIPGEEGIFSSEPDFVLSCCAFNSCCWLKKKKKSLE
jgi:hypothetical protein